MINNQHFLSQCERIGFSYYFSASIMETYKINIELDIVLHDNLFPHCDT